MSNNQDSFDELEKAWNEPVLTIDTVGNFSCNFRYDEAGANVSASADPQEELAHTTENSITPEKDDEIQFPLIEFINFDWLDPIDNSTPRLDSASDNSARQSAPDEHVIQAPCPSIDLSADSHDPETEDLAAQARRMALRAGRGLSSAGTNSQVFIDEVIDTRVPSGHSVFRRPIEHLLGGRSEDSATEAQTMASNSARAASIATSLQNPWLYKQAINADQHCQLTPRPSRPAVKTSVGGSSSYPHELFGNSTEHVAPDIELLTPFLDQHLPSEVESYGHQNYGTDAIPDYAYDYSQLSPSGTMGSFIQELDEDEPEHSPLTSTLQVPRMGHLRRHSGAGVTTRQGELGMDRLPTGLA
jgi:hypothetical protein